jgi:hypothetical protein
MLELMVQDMSLVTVSSDSELAQAEL